MQVAVTPTPVSRAQLIGNTVCVARACRSIGAVDFLGHLEVPRIATASGVTRTCDQRERTRESATDRGAFVCQRLFFFRSRFFSFLRRTSMRSRTSRYTISCSTMLLMASIRAFATSMVVSSGCFRAKA